MLAPSLLSLSWLGGSVAAKEKEMTLWWKLKHIAFDFLPGRNRLRCPECSAVGTFKPHGGWRDKADRRKDRRWMCKWCGLYKGPEKWAKKAFPSKVLKCWVIDVDTANEIMLTPQESMKASYPIGSAPDPWLG